MVRWRDRKSGVVFASITLILATNLFSEEDSWQLVSRRFRRLHRFDFWLVYSVVMSHMCHKSYFKGGSYQGTNDSWLTVSSWVICATKVISKEKVIKAQMTPVLQCRHESYVPKKVISKEEVIKAQMTPDLLFSFFIHSSFSIQSLFLFFSL